MSSRWSFGYFAGCPLADLAGANNKTELSATTKNNESDFSLRLKSLRGTRTQAEFAAFLGFSSQQTYQNYENGRIPKPSVLQQISQRTGVSMAYLLGEEQDTPSALENATSSISPKQSVTPELDISLALQEDSIPYRVADYPAILEKLLSKTSLDWLLDRVETLAKEAESGDQIAAATLSKIIPILKTRIESQP